MTSAQRTPALSNVDYKCAPNLLVCIYMGAARRLFLFNSTKYALNLAQVAVNRQFLR